MPSGRVAGGPNPSPAVPAPIDRRFNARFELVVAHERAVRVVDAHGALWKSHTSRPSKQPTRLPATGGEEGRLSVRRSIARNAGLSLALFDAMLASTGCGGSPAAPPPPPVVISCSCPLPDRASGACRPGISAGASDADAASWFVTGFPRDRLDSARVAHVRQGEAFLLTFGTGEPGDPRLDRVARVDWGSVNPALMAHQAIDRLSARLVAVAPGEVARTAGGLGPLYRSAFFRDGSCEFGPILACGSVGQSVECHLIERIVVDP